MFLLIVVIFPFFSSYLLTHLKQQVHPSKPLAFLKSTKETGEKGIKYVQSNNKRVNLLLHLCFSRPLPPSRKIDVLPFIICYCRQLTSTGSR